MMKVSELMALLQCANPDANVLVHQPRRWTKKQPDIARTNVFSVEIGACVIIKTT